MNTVISNTSRYRDFQGIVYTPYECLIQRLKDLQDDGKVLEYACVFHSRDLLDDGTPKSLHCHFAIRTSSYTVNDTVKKMFGGLKPFPGEENANVLVQSTTFVAGQAQRIDLNMSYRYFSHKDYPEKAQYSDDEITVSGGFIAMFQKGNKRERADNCFEILEEMLNGTSNYDLAKKYGRNFILNFDKYRKLIAAINEQYGDADHYANIKEYEYNKAQCKALGIDLE